jgi:hypothetical protein
MINIEKRINHNFNISIHNVNEFLTIILRNYLEIYEYISY